MTARSLAQYYKIDGDTLERAYKEHLSGYYEWEDLDHADRYLVFPKNFGPYMSIDETSTKDGELFTILSNKEGHCRDGSIAAIVRGTKRQDVEDALKLIPVRTRRKVKEITMDFSGGMAVIAEDVFPWADRVLDRFHMQKMAIDAVNNLRLRHKREAMKKDADARKKLNTEYAAQIARLKKYSKGFYETHHLPKTKHYTPEELSNGDTVAELLERSAYLIRMSPDQWSEKQKERACILFELFPDIKETFGLSHGLRVIFSNKSATKSSAKESLDKWYSKVSKVNNEDFNTLAHTLQSREDEVLNFFVNRSTNASAEALNTKIKTFRAQLRGIIDLKFFLFRLTKIYA